jgi:hypothetical protein
MPSCKPFCLGLATLCVLTVPILGQTFYGSVVGAITDSSGSPMPDATVTVTNTSTSERHSVVTTADGGYRFVNLVPGSYSIAVEKPGFKRTTRDGVNIEVAAIARLDISMEVGDVNQSVEVTGSAPLLQTENASLSQVVATRQVQELPLNGRNVLNLVSLAPGVVPQGSSDGNLTGKNVFAAGNYQIGGGTANQGASYYDGVPVNITYGNITALVPSQDAVSEFRVQTSNNTAEYGRYTGGVINLASRSGTNEFHGTAYEFLRNKALNAANFFANKTGAGKAAFVQNQFGADLGGPIIKDKTFFFFGYEGYRARQGNLFSETVPTPAELKGDFSGYLNASGAQIPIYDPLTQCGQYSNAACGSGTVQREPFPGNIIPANRINPVAAKILAFPEYGLPNTPGQPFTNNLNYARNASTGGNNDQINIRGDHQLSQKQRLLARYTRWNSTNLPVDVYGNGLRNGDPFSPEAFVTTSAVLADTYVFNPTTIFDIRAGFLRWDYARTPGTLGIDESAALGLPSYYQQIPALNGLTPSTTWPSIGVTSPTYNAIGTGRLLGRDDTYTLVPTLTWIKGRHTFKFGSELRKNELNYFQNNSPGGVFSFDNLFTSQNALSPGATGSGLASLELGLPASGTLQTSLFTFATLHYEGFFAADTWQVNNKLTLTLGLRYEIPGVYIERYNRQATFNPTEVNPALTNIQVNGHPVLGAFDLVNTPNHPEAGLNPEQYKLFAPRIGVAYRLDNKTVIRTGGGIFYIPSTLQFPQGPYSNPLDYFVNNMITTINSEVTPLNTLSNPYPNGFQPAPGRNPSYQAALLGGALSGHGDLQYEKYGYTYQWNFTVQHQFSGDLSLEAGYAGLRGKHLPQGGLNLNQINPQYLSLGSQLKNQVPNPFYGTIQFGTLSQPTVQLGQLLLPYPQYTSLTDPGGYVGDSTYHSLQVKAEKRFKSGGAVLASYTFSKILANVETLTTWLETQAGGVSGVQNIYNFAAEKSLSNFDSRQRLAISYVYDLPFGAGQRFLPDVHGFAAKIISGWGFNGVSTFQDGFPLGLTATPNTTGLNTGLRPDVAAGCNKLTSGSDQARISQWFNTSCFSVPAAYTFGNESRTDPVIRGPGINNFDLALFKRTSINERFNLEFRAEAFNLCNRVWFGPPNTVATTAANSTFGQITTQLNQPRLLQLALRLRY